VQLFWPDGTSGGSPGIDIMISSIRKFLSQFRYSVWIIEGFEVRSGTPLRILFVSGSTLNKNYIVSALFQSSPREINLGRFWMLKPLRFKAKNGGKFDLVITEIALDHPLDFNEACFAVPAWVDSRVNIDDSIELCKRSKSIKDDLRRIRKFGYSYQIANKKEKFIDFYNSMYVPYIKNNYGSQAALHSLEKILHNWEEGDLIQVFDGEKAVTGEVISFIPDASRAKLECIGVLHGDREYVRRAAISAIYYFRLIHLKEKGYAEIDLGASRGFLQDGVLQYKKKWGMHVTKAKGSRFVLHGFAKTEGARSLLINHPFISYDHDQDRLNSVCFVEAAEPPSKDQQKKIISQMTMPGTDKAVVYLLDESIDPKAYAFEAPFKIEFKRLTI
jgi:hypothetical protein